MLFSSILRLDSVVEDGNDIFLHGINSNINLSLCWVCFRQRILSNGQAIVLLKAFNAALSQSALSSNRFATASLPLVLALRLRRCLPMRFCTCSTQSSFSTLQSSPYIFCTVLNALLSPSETIQTTLGPSAYIAGELP